MHATATKVSLCAVLLALLGAAPAHAQQRIGYIDAAYILEQLPAYRSVQEQLDRKVQAWEAELDEARAELEELRRTYQARELLYTDQERAQKREEIAQAEQALEQMRQSYFGPEGRLYTEQQRLLRPVQERVLSAVETVAEAEGYDYVFDRSSEVFIMYAREQHDLSDEVLAELGIDVDTMGNAGR